MSETSKVLVGAYPPERAPGPEFVPSLSYQTDEMAALTNAIFSPKAGDAQTEEALLGKIHTLAQPLHDAIEAYIRRKRPYVCQREVRPVPS